MRLRIKCPPVRALAGRALQALESLFVVTSVACLAAFAWLQFEQRYIGAQYVREFERSARAARKSQPPRLALSANRTSSEHPEQKRTEPERNQSDGVGLKGELVLARLRVADIGLDAPVLRGVEARVLRRGSGWIPGTALPGENGNVGIAAHRDTFFRPLRLIRSGDRVELQTREFAYSYVVQSISVVEPEYTAPLLPTSEPTLTLITCFPFDYFGPAPRRYVVQAVADGAGGVWD